MAFQLTDKLPNVDLGAVKQHITNGITGNGLAIIAGQQIAPCGVIGIGDRNDDSAQSSGGIRILCAAGDIACVVICPGQDLDIFPYKTLRRASTSHTYRQVEPPMKPKDSMGRTKIELDY